MPTFLRFVHTCVIGLAIASVSLSSHARVKNPLDVPHYVKDIAYGEILYDYYQQRYFSSITKTLVAQEKGALDSHKDHAELLLGSLYVSYGLINEAESIFRRLLERTTKKETKDQAWFYLAALHYKRGNYDRSRDILNNELTKLSDELESERRILNAILLMKEKDYKKAVKELSAIPRQSRLNTYAKYNMAVAFASLGKGSRSTKLFDAILNKPKDDGEVAALKDKSALALGIDFLRQENYENAILIMSGIRLDSPFANPALLGLGWAHLSKGDYVAALTPWTELKTRDTVDRSVQEIYFHIPYVYEQLGAVHNALEGYLEAQELYKSEKLRIKQAIDIVNSITWVDTLSPPLDYSIDPLDALPDFKPPKSLDAYYLYQFFASHKFNESYRNYRELQRLSILIRRWQDNMPIFEGMLNLNKARLAELTPRTNETLALAKAKRNQFEEQLLVLRPIQLSALAGDNPAATASLGELEIKYRLDGVESLFEIHKESTFFGRQKKKLAFYKGVWLWNVSENAGQRYWNIEKQDIEINKQQVILNNKIEQLSLAHDIADKRFNGFEERFTAIYQSLDEMLVRIDNSLIRHQSYMQSIASEILQADITYLEGLEDQTLLALAHAEYTSFVADRKERGLLTKEDEAILNETKVEPPKRRSFLNIKSWWD